MTLNEKLLAINEWYIEAKNINKINQQKIQIKYKKKIE